MRIHSMVVSIVCSNSCLTGIAVTEVDRAWGMGSRKSCKRALSMGKLHTYHTLR
jgi:hypothetical protein